MPIGRFLSTPQNLLGLPLVLGMSACSYSPSSPRAAPAMLASLCFSLPQLCPVLGLGSGSSFAWTTPTSPLAFSSIPLTLPLVLSTPWPLLTACPTVPTLLAHVYFMGIVISLSFTRTDRCNWILSQRLLQKIVLERHGRCSFCSPSSWPLALCRPRVGP